MTETPRTIHPANSMIRLIIDVIIRVCNLSLNTDDECYSASCESARGLGIVPVSALIRLHLFNKDYRHRMLFLVKGCGITLPDAHKASVKYVHDVRG